MKVTRCSINPGNEPRSERPGIRIELSIQEAQLIESAITLAQLTNVPETFVRQIIELRFQITRALCGGLSATDLADTDQKTDHQNTEALQRQINAAQVFINAIEAIAISARQALRGEHE
jgi:hypothetical protein